MDKCAPPRPMFRAFGLTISCPLDLPLPRLQATAAEPDVRVQIDAGRGAGRGCTIESEVGVARLSATGDKVWIAPHEGADERALGTFLVGMVLHQVLLLRGWCSLHGGAVEIADGALAVLGPSGAGKSTLLGGFLRRGFRLLADDMLPVRRSTERGATRAFWEALPTYPSLRLWDDAGEMVGVSLSEGEPATGYKGKYVLSNLAERGLFCDRPLPISRLLVMAPRKDSPAGIYRPDDLPMRSAIQLVAPNVIAPSAPDAALRALQFKTIAALIRSDLVRVLVVGSGANGIGATIEVILTTMEEDADGATSREAG